MLELDSHLEALERSPPRGLVIRSGKAGGFIAGADVKEFAALKSAAQAERDGARRARHPRALEALPCPTVAIINGFALGGGLELALACRYRVGIKGDNFSIGLPEVMLGIHPGFGGTVRAVRLAGVRTAMQMMLTGKTLRADQARRAGFIDRLVFPADAEAAARELIARQPKPRRAPLAGSRAVAGRWCAASCASQLIAQVRAQGAARALPGALRHHRPVGRDAWRARRGRLRGRGALHRHADGG